MKANQSLGYYAIGRDDASSGVFKKIYGFTAAAAMAGMDSTLHLIRPGAYSHIALMCRIASAPESIVLVRCNTYGAFFMALGFVISRLRGRYLIIDVATPMTTVYREIWHGSGHRTAKLLKVAGLALSGPWCFWPAHRIIQYAPEGAWHSLGNQLKTRLLGNGVLVSSVPLRKAQPSWPSETLKLVGVAQVAEWHGYDLIIRAIADFMRKSPPYRIDFSVVGEGPAIGSLKTLVTELRIADNVRFTGSLSGEALFEEYSHAHLAIGSVALHRKGLTMASELKAREYCAAGIPFISSGADPDFSEANPYRYQVDTSDEDFEGITQLLMDLGQRSLPAPEALRAFAEAELDFRRKVSQVLGNNE